MVKKGVITDGWPFRCSDICPSWLHNPSLWKARSEFLLLYLAGAVFLNIAVWCSHIRCGTMYMVDMVWYIMAWLVGNKQRRDADVIKVGAAQLLPRVSRQSEGSEPAAQ